MPIVYFVEAPGTGRVKIGFTGKDSVDQRFAALAAGSPVPLALAAWGEGGRAYERAFHEKFATSWSHGEWFKLTPELEAIMERIGQGGPLPSVIDPTQFPRGIFIAHVLAGVDSDRARCLDPNYTPRWERVAK